MQRFNIDYLDQTLSSRHEQVVQLALVSMALLYAAYMFSLAIIYSDTDLWYHLTGGRYLLEHGQLYNPYVNSYLPTPEPFINYFWGFQLAMYLIWSIAGETGLLLSKAICFLTVAYLAAKIVLQGQSFKTATVLQLLIIAVVLGMLSARGLSLRPHVFSYVFISSFIFILGYRPRLYPLLPVLTVIWVNVHGVEWVVGGLICGAYFLQQLFEFWRNGADDMQSLKPLLWITLCLPAMLVSPNHVELLLTPFSHDAGLKLFISELRPFTWEASFGVNSGLSYRVLVIIFMISSIVCALNCLRFVSKHLAEFLLAIGGLVLLLNAERFVWEWMLLTLPLIASGLSYTAKNPINIKSLMTLTISMLAISWPLIPVAQSGWQHYPLNTHSLPYGTHRFIEIHELAGKYAIEPSYAGFTEFELSPAVKVHMDMQFPPFTSVNYQEIATAFATAKGLQTYVATHQPDMLGPRRLNTQFPTRQARELGFVPVFYDQHIVLFLNKQSYPELAEKFELKVINPFNEHQLQAGKIDAGIRELEQMMLTVDTPDVKLVLAGFLLEVGKVERADELATELVKISPNHPPTLYYHGTARQLLGDCDTALAAFERALPNAADPGKIHLNAALCYFVNKEMFAAYEHFQKSVNLFTDPNPDSLNFYQYALTAVAVGDIEGAIRILQMLNQHDPDAEFSAQARALLTDLKASQD